MYSIAIKYIMFGQEVSSSASFWIGTSKEKPQAQEQIVALDDLEGCIKRGFDEVIIEWAKPRTLSFNRSEQNWSSFFVTMPVYISLLLIHRCSWNSGRKFNQAELKEAANQRFRDRVSMLAGILLTALKSQPLQRVNSANACSQQSC